MKQNWIFSIIITVLSETLFIIYLYYIIAENRCAASYFCENRESTYLEFTSFVTF